MSVVHFITHPEVIIDPSVPVPDWPLSPLGTRRINDLLKRPWIQTIGVIFSSSERKAACAAAIVANHLGLDPIILHNLGENDRSATGYLPPAEFEAVADDFFARPEESIRGWERALDAQRRIVAAVCAALAMVTVSGDVAILSHGGVGALLLCRLKRVTISRSEDQPGRGGGNVFSFDGQTEQLIHDWQPIEED